MVFVNDSPAHSSNCEPQNRLADPLTSQGVDISERKRKGSSMETVISKLSRRQHRYTIKPATDSMTHYCAGKINNQRNVPMQTHNVLHNCCFNKHPTILQTKLTFLPSRRSEPVIVSMCVAVPTINIMFCVFN